MSESLDTLLKMIAPYTKLPTERAAPFILPSEEEIGEVVSNPLGIEAMLLAGSMTPMGKGGKGIATLAEALSKKWNVDDWLRERKFLSRDKKAKLSPLDQRMEKFTALAKKRGKMFPVIEEATDKAGKPDYKLYLTEGRRDNPIAAPVKINRAGGKYRVMIGKNWADKRLSKDMTKDWYPVDPATKRQVTGRSTYHNSFDEAVDYLMDVADKATDVRFKKPR